VYKKFEKHYAHLHIDDSGDIWFVENTTAPSPLAVRFEVVRLTRQAKFKYYLQAHLFGRTWSFDEANEWEFIINIFKGLR